MEYRFVAPDLRRWDTLKTEAVAVGLFLDDRPPRDALGLLDWRLCGYLSEQLAAGRVDGRRSERWLVPCRGRLPVDKLFVFGLGHRDVFDATAYRALLSDMLETLTQARVRTALVGLPGRAAGLIAAEQAMDVLLELTRGASEQDELILIEEPDAQKAMERQIQQERRRVRAADT